MKKFASKFLIAIMILSIVNYKFSPTVHASTDNVRISTKYTGKGIKIAIIDVGIDITHPDLKNKIIGGYDFIENKPIYKDGDGRKGHGTHVAGIAAANGKMTGIAPDALLLIYRAVDKRNSDKTIIAAINRAVADGADVINISCRIYVDAPNNEVEKAVKNAVDKGVVVVKSNGNYGPNLWTTCDLSGSPYVISVGNCTSPSNAPIIKSNNNSIKLNLLEGSDEFKPVKRMSYSGNFKLKPMDKKHLKNKLVIMHYKKQDLNELGRELKSYGVVGLILTGAKDNEFFTESIYEPKESIPIAYVTDTEAINLRKMIKNNSLSLSNYLSQKVYYRSSRGPAKGNWILKPDIVAPGTKVLSTVPKEINESGYGYNTGTSMSAPYITGSVALIKQAHPDWTPSQVKSAICNNASLLQTSHNKPYSVLNQGSGVINIEKAINTDSFIMPNNLSFSLIKDNDRNKTIAKSLKIENISKAYKNYSISLQKENDFKGITIDFKPQLKVNSNSSETFKINVRVASSTPSGIYSGRILFKNGDNEKLVPFIILVDPNNYPLISGFRLSQSKISLKVDNKYENTYVKYYIPDSADKVVIKAKKINAENISFIINENTNIKQGYTTFVWNGKDINNKYLPSGMYFLEATAYSNERNTTLESEVITIDKKGECKIICLKTNYLTFPLKLI